MKTLDDFNFYDKTVLIRADLNSEVINGKIAFSERIKEAAQTIFEIKRRGGKIVVIAHQGRKGEEDYLNLKQHAKLLNYYGKIKFVEDIIGEKAIENIKKLKIGEVILLDNIRFVDDEFRPEKGRNNKLIKILAPLMDIYINDAFSVCHRKQTSVVSFPKYLPSGIGRLLEKELKALKKIDIKNTLFILGGAKPDDNLKLISEKNILTCGNFCHISLVAKGFSLGAQEEYLKKEFKHFDEIVNTIKKNLDGIMTPVDFAVEYDKKRYEIELEKFPNEYRIYDIGSKTIEKYAGEIDKAKTIFFKGPSGMYTDKKFRLGTYKILQAVARSKAYSIIAGGHSNEALKACKISKSKFSYVSLSGGALISYLAGEKLPGLEVLK